jgi:glycosidase
MAHDTPLNYRCLVIYQVYVRNHSAAGTFAALGDDLARIRSLGVDILYLMPVHPIGKINKKGGLGCPYSIADYEAVNPKYGTRQDFLNLIDRAHAAGLKVMIDLVFNHTAHDARLAGEHPDWFHQDENGHPVTTVPEWSDVIDLKHPNSDLWNYLYGVVQGWVRDGVDGFRCDVASLLPPEFWMGARQAAAEISPDIIWMAESVHAVFVKARRDYGLLAWSDSELYPAFDILYDYDIWPQWQAAVCGDRLAVERYLEMLMQQDCIYPANYAKMRCVENHDQPRIMEFAPTRAQALAWTAFMAFNKGPFFIYAGQESAATHTPSLFDYDKVDWGDYELADFLTTLAALKKEPALLDGQLIFTASHPAVQAAWFLPGESLFGIFNTGGTQGVVELPLSDGVYEDLLGGEALHVHAGSAHLPPGAVVVKCRLDQNPTYLSLPGFVSLP